VEMCTWCTPGVWPVERAKLLCVCMCCREEIMALSLGYGPLLGETLSVSSQKCNGIRIFGDVVYVYRKSMMSSSSTLH